MAKTFPGCQFIQYGRARRAEGATRQGCQTVARGRSSAQTPGNQMVATLRTPAGVPEPADRRTLAPLPGCGRCSVPSPGVCADSDPWLLSANPPGWGEAGDPRPAALGGFAVVVMSSSTSKYPIPPANARRQGGLGGRYHSPLNSGSAPLSPEDRANMLYRVTISP